MPIYQTEGYEEQREKPNIAGIAPRNIQLLLAGGLELSDKPQNVLGKAVQVSPLSVPDAVFVRGDIDQVVVGTKRFGHLR